MNKKIIAFTLVLSLAGGIIGCQNHLTEIIPQQQEEIKTDTTETVAVPKTKKDKTAVTKGNGPRINSIAEAQENIRTMLPSLCKQIKTLMIEQSTRVHEDLDFSNTQILLTSNLTRTAVLINNQNPAYGPADEIIEYSLDTIEDPSIATTPFGKLEFNGQETYVFNIDTYSMTMTGEKWVMRNYDTLLHEGTHIFYQNELLGMNTHSSNPSGLLRAESYPIPVDNRILRAQMMHYYKQALLSIDEATRIDSIKRANYFYEEFLTSTGDDHSHIIYDQLEGQATYFQYRSRALLEDINMDDATHQSLTTKKFIAEYPRLSDNKITSMNENNEYYAIGATVYALIYDMNLEKDLGTGHPIEYLIQRYGSEKNDGVVDITHQVKSSLDAKNEVLKQEIDKIDLAIADENNVAVRIPINLKHKQNQVGIKGMHSINYDYQGQQATIEELTNEYKIGDNRLKLTQASVISTSVPGQFAFYYYAYVPADAIEVNNDRLTIQTPEIQIYDVDFELVDGVYQIKE